MKRAAVWTPFALILTLCLTGCGTGRSSWEAPPQTRLVRACPTVEPLEPEFRAALLTELQSAGPALTRAVAEWQAERERARACAETQKAAP